MSLRTRVAAAAAAAIALALVLLVIAVPKLFGRELRSSLDDTLRRRAADVAQLNASAPAELTQPGALEGRLTGGSLYVQVIDKTGRLVVRSSALGARLLPENAAVRRALEDRRPELADAALGPEPVRLYAAPLGSLSQGPGSGGAVIVAGTTTDIDRTVDRARTLLALCALAAAALAALLATLLTRRALRPLARLSSGARAIERSGDVSERLPLPVAHDEVGQLADTLNAMLASLERAREAEHRFVGDASHELRTPLTALRGNAAYVVRHGADPAVLADIEADAARLGVLLDDLLALAREDAAAPARGEPVDLVQLAREAEADEVVVIRPGTVHGEKPALERAVGNLVRNARSHGRGRVTVTVDGGVLSVSDEGAGPRDPVRAFERFWREGGEGSGLGLAIVKAIAERHGGTVTVSGSRFTLAIKELSESPRTTASSTSEGPSP
ncbi:sensor histidine kinase [Candidatus Solirubrobacter pratensis]|uniref:sensor histidine kinase n=1 Tax=Candidatus Solirubrobacter pratensis TaxID=1298857 RepID=UPI0004109E10|nr:HAMP domain-containing sensor histidine kinase [Candidatus Solirubrobacter pratensis]